MQDEKTSKVKKHIVDPDLFADTLGISWFYDKAVPTSSESKAIIFNNSYCFVLDGTNDEPKMEVFFSDHSPEMISISTKWTGEAGSGHVLVRDITNVVYQKEKRKVIIESKKGEYYSVLEITRGTLHFPDDACHYVLQVNIDEKKYQKEFKNYL